MSNIDQPQGSSAEPGALEEKPLGDIKRGPGKDITISKSLGAVEFENVENVITLGQAMARAGVAIPAHLRDNPGACMAVVFYASEWRMSPFSVANKTYVVKDRLAFEAQLVHAVIEMRAPIHEDILNKRYEGEGPDRKCIVWAQCKIRGVVKTLEHTSPRFADIQPKNSPLWQTKPDVQLWYNTSRDWARVFFPHILMGVYSADELVDSETMRVDHARDVTPNRAVVERLQTGEGFKPDNVTRGIDELSNVVPDAEIVPAGDRTPEKPAGAPEAIGGTEGAATAPKPATRSRRKPQPPADPSVEAMTTTASALNEARSDPPAPQPGETTPPAETAPPATQGTTGDGNSPLDDKNLDRGGGGPIPTAEAPAGRVPDPNADPGTQRPLVDEKPAQPQPPAAKEPSSPEEYEAHLDAWLATVATEDALDERWRAEKDLRGRCRVIGDAFDKAMSKRNARKKELRG
jgi:hypothetical protein